MNIIIHYRKYPCQWWAASSGHAGVKRDWLVQGLGPLCAWVSTSVPEYAESLPSSGICPFSRALWGHSGNKCGWCQDVCVQYAETLTLHRTNPATGARCQREKVSCAGRPGRCEPHICSWAPTDRHHGKLNPQHYIHRVPLQAATSKEGTPKPWEPLYWQLFYKQLR